MYVLGACNVYIFQCSLLCWRTATSIVKIGGTYRMAGYFGGKIFWRIAEIMTFGGIYFGG